MNISLICKKGGRDYNQDYAAFYESGGFCFLAVADGLGSYDGSEVAAELAVKGAAKAFMRAVQKGDSPLSKNSTTRMFKRAHASIRKAKELAPELYGSCTTLATAITDENRITIAHTGDTRAYLIRDGKILHFTKDHSLARLAAERGEITYAEIRTHADQNKLFRVLGSDKYVQPDVFEYSEIKYGDAVVLCSDGFWEYVWESDLVALLNGSSSAEEAMKKAESILLDRAPSYNDNYSAIFFIVGGNSDNAAAQDGDDTLKNENVIKSENAENSVATAKDNGGVAKKGKNVPKKGEPNKDNPEPDLERSKAEKEPKKPEIFVGKTTHSEATDEKTEETCETLPNKNANTNGGDGE